MKIYRGEKCLGCALRSRCTAHPRGRTISRWEYEGILEDMRQRVESNRTKDAAMAFGASFWDDKEDLESRVHVDEGVRQSERRGKFDCYRL